MMDSAEFEDLVFEALATIPEPLQGFIENVHVLTKMWPSRDELVRAGVSPGHTLLGLYSGIPLTERTSSYNLVMPDTITLYQGPIEREAGADPEAIRALARHVTIHEFAHHFGISDDRLRELGAY
jgi:predicted Zn-dependent protease with MMP-like domain